MPKIPTFTTEATITGEVGSVQSNTQMSLTNTIGNVLAPVTKEIVQHRVKQKDFENKTEALKLENDFIRDMQSVYDQAGNLQNESQAQNLVKTQSNTLIKKYSGLASNRGTQDLFNQYALSEVQKGIFRTSTAVQKNTLIKLDTLVNEKKERLMLNFGHTFAHAIEMSTDISKKDFYRHGEAVGLGILCELYYSNKKENKIKCLI